MHSNQRDTYRYWQWLNWDLLCGGAQGGGCEIKTRLGGLVAEKNPARIVFCSILKKASVKPLENDQRLLGDLLQNTSEFSDKK